MSAGSISPAWPSPSGSSAFEQLGGRSKVSSAGSNLNPEGLVAACGFMGSVAAQMIGSQVCKPISAFNAPTMNSRIETVTP